MFRALNGVLSLFVLALAATLCSVSAGAANGVVTIQPTHHDFGAEVVGLKTPLLTVTIFNPGPGGVGVTGFQLSDPAFQLTQGIAPVTVGAGATTHYTLQFAPTAQQAYSGTFSVFINNGQTLTLKLSGTGTTTTAQAALSTNLLDFGTVSQGQTVTQTVTLSNVGTQAFTLQSATTQPPFSLPAVVATVIQPGGSLPLTISLSPSTVGTASQLLALAYDSLPGQGVNLAGTVIAASSLAGTTFPALPSATQQASYTAYLAAAGGTSPYSWSLQAGSVLPLGLSLSSSGVVSGTLDPSVATGTYTFTVAIADSSVPQQLAAQQLTLTVGAPTGANCNNIQWNVAGTNSPILGLDVLGTGTYLGAQGGLYPNGSNVRPSSHTNYGVGLAQAVQPLDSQGHPDPNGKEVLVILGESNVEIEAEGITADTMADPMKNPAVVVVNAGIGNGTAAQWSNRNSGFWTTILNYVIPNYGVTPAQVIAVWAEPTDGLNTGTFPTDIASLQSQIENEARNLLYYFPHIKLAYFSSRIYSGYSNGINTINPEPYAFEDSFAVKWAIQDQLNGKKSLNFDPSKGTVVAPWMSWGPYTWANGLVIASTAGYVWSCQDQKDDGTHPNHTTGREEVANQVLNFFKTDATTAPWFLAP